MIDGPRKRAASGECFRITGRFEHPGGADGDRILGVGAQQVALGEHPQQILAVSSALDTSVTVSPSRAG